MDDAEAPHILVVDDDSRLRELLRRYLSENGFKVTTAGSAAEARGRLGSFAFDVLILDVMMPEETGIEFTRAFRVDSPVPILMLTAMGEANDRIDGLECGADDYLTKPFEPRELVLRIRNLLRRAPAEMPVSAAPVEVRLGRCVFDLEREELREEGAVIRLTTAESGLLKLLALSAGSILAREDLIESSGGGVSERTIDVQVTRLRRKIEPDPRVPRYLHTVRGKGYVLRPD